MLNFIVENLSTIIISILILGVVILIIRKMIKDSKQGKSFLGCGMGCENCPHRKKTKKK